MPSTSRSAPAVASRLCVSSVPASARLFLLVLGHAVCVAWLAFLQGPHIVTVCHSTRESSTCLAAVADGTLRPSSNALVPFLQVACPAHMGHFLHSANPDLICLPLVFVLFLQPPQLPTRLARRLCCMAPLSVCVRPTTCCWATSASTGPPTCLQEQCPTRCPSPTGAAVAVAAGEWRLLVALEGVRDHGEVLGLESWRRTALTAAAATL